MKRNICKCCSSKSEGNYYKITGLHVHFWLCNDCTQFRKKDYMPLKMSQIIK